VTLTQQLNDDDSYNKRNTIRSSKIKTICMISHKESNLFPYS